LILWRNKAKGNNLERLAGGVCAIPARVGARGATRRWQQGRPTRIGIQKNCCARLTAAGHWCYQNAAPIQIDDGVHISEKFILTSNKFFD